MLIPQCIIFCLGRNDHIIVTKWRSGISALILYVFPLLLNLWVKKLLLSPAVLRIGIIKHQMEFCLWPNSDATSPLPETHLPQGGQVACTKMMTGLSRTYRNDMVKSMSTKWLESRTRSFATSSDHCWCPDVRSQSSPPDLNLLLPPPPPVHN